MIGREQWETSFYTSINPLNQNHRTIFIVAVFMILSTADKSGIKMTESEL